MAESGRQATPEESRTALVLWLTGPKRRHRQEASRDLAEMITQDPEMGLPIVDRLIDALNRPEAQTRWECLDALAAMAPTHPEEVAPACEGAEESLFDEDSAAVNLAAFKFLAAYGSTSVDRSDRVWPLLDEAIQCYHGDPEYREMLESLVSFAKGPISDKSREALVSRVAFDAKNGRGYIRTFSADIMEISKQ